MRILHSFYNHFQLLCIILLCMWTPLDLVISLELYLHVVLISLLLFSSDSSINIFIV